MLLHMNGRAARTGEFCRDWCCIKSAVRRGSLVLGLGIISLLSACASTPSVTPVRVPDLTNRETGQRSYLWTSGLRPMTFTNMEDYATITQIDGIDIADYLPRPDSAPVWTWLLDIPAGRHVVEVLYEEDHWFCGYMTCYFDQSRQTLTFTAAPNQAYVPFADDYCSRDWFWIENWGPYVAGSETRRTMRLYHDRNRESHSAKPVVAGEMPSKNSCE